MFFSLSFFLFSSLHFLVVFLFFWCDPAWGGRENPVIILCFLLLCFVAFICCEQQRIDEKYLLFRNTVSKQTLWSLFSYNRNGWLGVKHQVTYSSVWFYCTEEKEILISVYACFILSFCTSKKTSPAVTVVQVKGKTDWFFLCGQKGCCLQTASQFK